VGADVNDGVGGGRSLGLRASANPRLTPSDMALDGFRPQKC
jgi:hypothetical protein